MNCAGGKWYLLICIRQVIRIIQPVNQLTSNYIVWKPGTHTDHSSLFVLTVFNYKHIPDNCLFCCDANQASDVEGTYHPNQENWGIPNMPTRSVLRLTVPLQFVVIHNCIPDATLYIPDHRLETCGRHYLYETGFLIYSGCGCLRMASFQWKLNLWRV